MAQIHNDVIVKKLFRGKFICHKDFSISLFSKQVIFFSGKSTVIKYFSFFECSIYVSGGSNFSSAKIELSKITEKNRHNIFFIFLPLAPQCGRPHNLCYGNYISYTELAFLNNPFIQTLLCKILKV